MRRTFDFAWRALMVASLGLSSGCTIVGLAGLGWYIAVEGYNWADQYRIDHGFLLAYSSSGQVALASLATTLIELVLLSAFMSYMIILIRLGSGLNVPALTFKRLRAVLL